jgi:hypothetical protein
MKLATTLEHPVPRSDHPHPGRVRLDCDLRLAARRPSQDPGGASAGTAEIELAGLIDDFAANANRVVRGFKVIGTRTDLGRLRSGGIEALLIGFGPGLPACLPRPGRIPRRRGARQHCRCRRARRLLESGTVVLPHATLSGRVRIGSVATIGAGATVLSKWPAFLRDRSLPEQEADGLAPKSSRERRRPTRQRCALQPSGAPLAVRNIASAVRQRPYHPTDVRGTAFPEAHASVRRCDRAVPRPRPRSTLVLQLRTVLRGASGSAERSDGAAVRARLERDSRTNGRDRGATGRVAGRGRRGVASVLCVCRQRPGDRLERIAAGVQSTSIRTTGTSIRRRSSAH